MALSSRWTKHIKSEEGKKEFERKLLTNIEIFDIIKDILMEDLETSRRKGISEETFEKPNWPEYQAYQAGIQKQIQRLLNILPDQRSN